MALTSKSLIKEGYTPPKVQGGYVPRAATSLSKPPSGGSAVKPAPASKK